MRRTARFGRVRTAANFHYGVLMLCAPELRRHYRALMRQLVYQTLDD